jgi:hypothetical protein
MTKGNNICLNKSKSLQTTLNNNNNNNHAAAIAAIAFMIGRHKQKQTTIGGWMFFCYIHGDKTVFELN